MPDQLIPTPTDSMFYRRTVVLRADDDSPCPRTGRVIGWIDEETCRVEWSETDEFEACTSDEYRDELTTTTRRAGTR